MTKRPSLFAPKHAETVIAEREGPPPAQASTAGKRPPSRDGKRVLSVYLDPLAWKQLRQLGLDNDTTNQKLGEEAVNLLFAKYGINRSA